MEETIRKLTRSQHNRVVGGICGGVAEYVGWDPVAVRVIFMVLTILSFGVGGVLMYLIAWMMIPEAGAVTGGRAYEAQHTGAQGDPEPASTDTLKPKRLTRSQEDRKIAGVCGGIARYFAVDPTLVRLLWLVSFFAAGTGLIIYIVLWIAMPIEY